MSGEATFTLTPVDDGVAEGDEAITVSGSASGLTVEPAALTLEDDDEASTSVELSVSPAVVSEDGGAQQIAVTAALAGAARSEATSVTVSVGATGDAAASGTDYQAVSDFVLTIPEGFVSGEATFTLTPVDDGVAEGDEAITVSGSASGLAVDPAELTLEDDDEASTSVELSVSPASASEDGGAQQIEVTAALAGAARLEATAVTVSVGAAGDAAASGTDYQAVSDFVLTIPEGFVSGEATFTLTPVDDEIAEGDEAITVLGSASGLTVEPAALTLEDDDEASSSVELSVSPASASEDGGAQQIEVTAALAGAARSAATSVTVSVGAAGDSAASGTDYQAVADFVLTIAPEALSGEATFTLTPEDDGIAEGDEAITVRGSASGLSVEPAELTLEDDDEASTSVELSVSPGSVSEDGGAQQIEVTAALDGAARSEATPVTVSVGAAGDSAVSGTDYQAASDFVLTIPEGFVSGEATFTLTPVDDGVAEGDEAITVSGSAVGLTVEPAELALEDDDEASTSVELSVSPAVVSEDGGAQQIAVTAALAGAARSEATSVTVSVGATGDAAASGTDYQAVSDFVLTIPEGFVSGEATFTLTPVDDRVAEGDEAITVSGSAVGLTVEPVELTLEDDDEASTSVELSVSPAVVSEDGGAQQIAVTAALDGAARSEATAVNLTVGGAGDSAVSGTDYASVAGFVLTIEEGRTSGTATFTLTPEDDGIAEGDEAVTVRGSASGLTVNDATLALEDDDTASTSVSLSVSPASASEDGGAQQIAVTAALAGAARSEATPVTVSVGAAGDSAVSGTDYQAASDFVLTIPEGFVSGEATFTLTPVDDGIAEGDEAITVHGTVSGLSVEPAELTLEDDDEASTSVELSVSPRSVSEDGGARQIEVTAALDGAARSEATPVTVSVGAAGDAAASGTDYQAVSDFVLTIPEGFVSGEATFTLTPVDDGVAEGDEAITVRGTASGLTVEPAALTLEDDDEASTSVELSVSPASASEDGGAQQIAVTAALDGAARSAATAVTVSVGAAGDTAASGTDYQAVSDFVLTIPEGFVSGEATFTLTPVDDRVAEGDEAITVSGSAVGLTVEPVELTLEDDDEASTSVELSVSPRSVSEDGGAQQIAVTAALDGAARSEATAVNLTVGGAGDSAVSGTDYASVAGFVLTIEEGRTSGTATFTLTPEDDGIAEGDEAVTVRGSASGLTVNDATLALEDDDTASTSVSLSVSPASASEDGGAQQIAVTAALAGAARSEATPVTVSVGAAGDSAVSGTDYQAASDFVLTIPEGFVSGEATFTLTPVDDGIAEGDEAITVHGTVSGLSVEPAELTLEDDDEASTSVELSVSPRSVSEDGGAQQIAVTAALDGAARSEATPVTVSVGAAGDAAASGTDYQAVSDFVLTIPEGFVSGEATFTLTPVDDEIAEGDEAITVSGSASGLTVDPAALTLEDDDEASSSVELSVSPASASEDGGAQQIEVTAALAGAARSAATSVTVSVGAAGDSAASGTDYQAVADFVLTIAPEALSGEATFTLTPEDDGIAEGDEAITVRGSASGLTVEPAALTLEDDDEASTSVELSVSPGSVSEDGGAQQIAVTAALAGAARLEATPVTVSVGAAGDAAASGTDYQAVSDFVLTIAPGALSGEATFTLTPVDDGVAEGDEAITVSGSASGLTVEPAALTLKDDDEASTSVELSVSPAVVSEDGGAQQIAVTAALAGAARLEATPVTVSVGATGDAAASGTDYQAVPDFVLTIPEGFVSGEATFTLTPVDDGVAEGDEAITVSGSASGLAVDPAALTLEDDDEASTSVELSVSPGSVSEDGGAQQIEVTAALAGAARSAATSVTVSVGAAGDSAASGTDYQAVADFVLTIAPEALSGEATFTLTPVDDEIAEGDEAITVSGSAVGLTVEPAELTLEDDDEASTSVELSVSPAVVSEDGGAQQIAVTAALAGAARSEATSVTVSVGATGDAAASGTDYQAVSDFVLTIPEGSVSGEATFTLTPVDDEIAEGDEAITVRGSASGLTVEPAALTLEDLEDDDEASSSVELSVSPESVSEDGGAQQIAVTAALDGAARLEATAVTVSVGAAGDAAASGSDYQAVSDFVLTIAPGALSGEATFTLTPVDDEIAEGDEAITVRGTASGLAVEPAELTLEDDDEASTSVELSVSPASASEDGGAQQIEVTAALAGAARLEATAVTVSVGAAGDAAASGTDYQAVSDFVLTIAPEALSGEATFTLTPEDDGIAEGDEAITVRGSASGLTVEPAALTLEDDDEASTSVELSVSPGSVSEDGGAQQIAVTAALAGAARLEATPVTVSVGAAGDAAASGTDYQAVSDFVLTIAPGALSGEATFTLTPVDDGVAEGDEAITVSGSASGLTVEPAALTLKDDDEASTSVELSVSPGSVSEDGGAQQIAVTAALAGAARLEATPVTVSVGATGDAAASGTDYQAVPDFVLTIPEGFVSGEATFTLTPVDDGVAEGDEAITVSGSASGLAVDPAALTLEDDDEASTSVELSVSPGSVSEDGGAQQIEVTAALAGAARSAATSVTVTVGAAGDAAASGTDYQAVSDFVLTIAPGALSGEATFTLTPVDDGVAEGDEAITVRGSASGLTVEPAELTLEDDDEASTSVTLSVSPASASEDGGAQQIEVTAALAGAARTEATSVTVSVGAAGDSAASGTDYQAVPDIALTIPVGSVSGEASFTLTPVDDGVAEGDERITVTGAGSGLSVDPAELTLEDDDAASTSVDLSVSPGSVSEDGATVVAVLVELMGAPAAEEIRFEIAVGESNDSATAGQDYEEVRRFVLSIPGGESRGSSRFVFTPLDDADSEGTESITIIATPVGVQLAPARATLDLNDNDEATEDIVVSSEIRVRDARASEGSGSMSFAVVLDSPSPAPIAVDWGTQPAASDLHFADEGADYRRAFGTLVIPSGNTTGRITVPLLDDRLDEHDEHFELLLYSASAGQIVDDVATGTIVDDDGPELRIADVRASESSGWLDFEVSLSAPSIQAITGRLATADATAFGGEDYKSVDASFRISPGRQHRVVQVQILDDSLDEDDETLVLSVADVRNARVVKGDAEGMIEDDDASPTLLTADSSAAEGDGELVFLVRLAARSGRVVSVDYRTSDADAREGEDFEGVSGTIEFTPGELSKRIAVPVLDDDLDEVDEKFHLLLSAPTNAVLEIPQAVGTIEDDDAEPTLRVEDATTSESAGMIEFGATLDAPAGRDLIYLCWTTDGEAHAGQDYEGQQVEWVIPAGVTTAVAAVSLIDDALDETDETFTVSFANPREPRNAAVTAVGTIEDDDAEPTLRVEDATTSESAGMIEFGATLDAPAGRDLIYLCWTTDGEAHAGQDYEGQQVEWVIPAGVTTAVAAVSLIDDALDETDETFTVSFANPREPRNAAVTAVGTIEDDDAEPTLRVEDATTSESAGMIEFGATLDAPAGRDLIYLCWTTDGEAHAGQDYEGQQVEWVIPAGATTAVAAVSLIDDALDETDETFTVSFANPREPRNAAVTAVGTIEDDDAEPTLRIEDATASESAGMIEFGATLDAPAGRDLIYLCWTTDGEAHAGEDYEEQQVEWVIPAGATTAVAAVSLIDDALDETDETFTVSFANPREPRNAAVTAVGTIEDDDAEPTLRIEDATASESAGMIEFGATLDAPAGRDLIYLCWTTDGEAHAGEDYEEQQVEWVIPAGATTAVAAVSLIDDALDETDETFTVSFANPREPGNAAVTAVGTIEDDDENAPVMRMWITRFGRSVATQLIESVEERMDAGSRATRFSLGGDPMQTLFQVAARDTRGESWSDLRARANGLFGVDGGELLGRSSFLIQQASESSGRPGSWAVWGRGTTLRFSGEDDGINMRGDVLTATIGADYRRGRMLAGFALANSIGNGPFTVAGSNGNGSAREGRAHGRIATLSPYLSVPLNERISVWGLGGYGIGTVSLAAEDADSDLSMLLGALGVRADLRPGTRRLRVAVKADMFWASMDAGATAVRLASTGVASRGRILTEGSWRLGSLWGGEITPILEAGVRYDGGDAETGLGLEFGSGVRYERPASGLSVELNGRTLVAHQDTAYREWGIGGKVSLDSGMDRRGPSLTIASSLGDALSGVNRMWKGRDRLAERTRFAPDGGGQLEAEFAYGFGSLAGGPVTPFAGVSWQEQGNRVFRLGSRLDLGSSLQLSLEGSRRESYYALPDHSFVIRGHLR